MNVLLLLCLILILSHFKASSDFNYNNLWGLILYALIFMQLNYINNIRYELTNIKSYYQDEVKWTLWIITLWIVSLILSIFFIFVLINWILSWQSDQGILCYQCSISENIIFPAIWLISLSVHSLFQYKLHKAKNTSNKPMEKSVDNKILNTIILVYIIWIVMIFGVIYLMESLLSDTIIVNLWNFVLILFWIFSILLYIIWLIYLPFKYK